MDTYLMASLRSLVADVVIVRECTHGQVRVLYGDIVGVEGDIMVIPANSRLAGREGLDERMQEAAGCLLYTSPSPRDRTRSRMPSSA